jgi:hypothetical protein
MEFITAGATTQINSDGSFYTGKCPREVAQNIILDSNNECNIDELTLFMQDQKYIIKSVKKPSLLEKLRNLQN